MGILASPARVAVGVSSMPNTSVGVLVIGDVALEVNELDLEWRNVYDGDTYVCTQLRVSALSLVHTDELHTPGSNIGRNIGRFISAVLSQSYTVSNPIRSISRPQTEVVDSVLNIDPSIAKPSSTTRDHIGLGFDYTTAAGMQADPKLGHRLDNKKGSVVCIPPANFAVLYKPSVMVGLATGNPSIQHHPAPAFSSCGVNIPGWAMFQPIEVELVSLDSNVGHDISALRVVVSVYFNMSSISSGSSFMGEPAYHKWSVSSTWTVGHKPRIVVNGRLVRRMMVTGAPSLWEWLPRTMPGLHLVQLDTSSDHDGKVTSYTAVYELDFVTPIFTSENLSFVSPRMASTSYAVAYYTVHETAETVTQGGMALEYAYETQLARASTEADMTNAMLQNVYGLMKSLLAAGVNIANDIANAIGAAAGAAGGAGAGGGGLGGFLRGLGSALGGFLSGGGSSAIGQGANVLIDVAAARAHQNRLQVNRFVSNMSIDRSALSSMANTVVRTAIIEVYGYPGALVDTLQVAALTIAKQIYMGWLVMALNPLQRFGWLVRNVLQYQNALQIVRDMLTSGVGLQNTTNAAPASGNILGGIGDLLRRIAGALIGNPAQRLIYDLAGIPRIEWMAIYQPVDIVRDSFEDGWKALFRKWWFLLTNPEAYSMPRRYPGFLVLTTGGNREAEMKSEQMSVDDVLSVMLATMGIHKIQTYVAVDHTVPMVRLQLSVIFKSLEYSGNVALHSMWRVFGRRYHIFPYECNKNGDAHIPSISTMVPAILPLSSGEAFNFYINETMMNSGFPQSFSWVNPEGPQRVFTDGDSRMSTFAHLYYDLCANNNDGRRKAVLGKHTVDQYLGSQIYAHGGSIGTGFITPTIVPSYNRPNLAGRYYASGLGAGVALDYLSVLSRITGWPVGGFIFKHAVDPTGDSGLSLRNNWL